MKISTTLDPREKQRGPNTPESVSPRESGCCGYPKNPPEAPYHARAEQFLPRGILDVNLSSFLRCLGFRVLGSTGIFRSLNPKPFLKKPWGTIVLKPPKKGPRP